jgi:hypothetical protein
MSGLIFFAVVAGWTWLCVWVARKVGKRWFSYRPTWIRFAIGVLTFAVLLPLPLIDEIIGKLHFDRLCREEAGVKVYGKLTLGPEFFDANGAAVLIPGTSNIRTDLLVHLDILNPSSLPLPSLARISKKRYDIRSCCKKPPSAFTEDGFRLSANLGYLKQVAASRCLSKRCLKQLSPQDDKEHHSGQHSKLHKQRFACRRFVRPEPYSNNVKCFSGASAIGVFGKAFWERDCPRW